MSETKTLSSLQMRVMRVLWTRGEATTSEIHDDILAERDLAFTTIATIISRLAKQGVVAYRKEGRQYVYRAAVSEEAVRQSMVADLVETVFGGNAKALVSHLLGETDISAGELVRLRTMARNAGPTSSEKDEQKDHE